MPEVSFATQSLQFPFSFDELGTVITYGGTEELRGKIIQVLFTAPGERIHQPEFGCGLFNLVFEPNDTLLATAVQFSIGQALTRWLANELIVDSVNVASDNEYINIEVVYTRKQDLVQQAVRIQFK